jgi:hypothetical protein
MRSVDVLYLELSVHIRVFDGNRERVLGLSLAEVV